MSALALLVGAAVRVAPTGFGWSDANRRTIYLLLREVALVMALYSIWQIVGSWSLIAVDDALERGRWVVSVQRHLPLPPELTIQRWVLPYPSIVKGANLYYAIAHVPFLVGTLIWAFFGHRDQYPLLRNAVALTTGACLIVQFIPLAPPRMLEDLGFVDTALLYDQSVYSALGRGMAGQLAAMPSVHVAWAVIVGWFALVSPVNRSLRVICVAHAVVTNVVVVVTANHFWLDGIVACLFFGLSLLIAQRHERRAGGGASGPLRG